MPWTRVIPDQAEIAFTWGRKNRSPLDICTRVADWSWNTSGSIPVWMRIVTAKAEMARASETWTSPSV